MRSINSLIFCIFAGLSVTKDMTLFKNRILKKIFKILLWIFGSFIAFDLILVLLIFIPPIQNALIGKVSTLLTEKWGSEISAGKIYLSPTLKVNVYDFVIKDGNHQDMIRVDKASARIKKIGIKPFVLSFGELNGIGGDVNVVKYRGDDTVNIAKWARKISNRDKKSNFTLKAEHLTLESSRFCFTNENEKFHSDTSNLMDFGYLELKDISFDANNFIVQGPDVGADINHLSFNQYTGFSLLESKANFRINEHELIFTNAQLKTKTSQINMDLHFLYNDWSDYAEFVDSVNINTILKPSILDFEDVSCWVNKIRGMDEKVYISGNIINNVNDLSVNDLRCFVNANTEICGDFHIKNITDFFNAYFDVNLCVSKLNFNELDSIALPKGKRISLPQPIKRVGSATLEGYFKGYLTDFRSDIILCSEAGDAHVNFSCNNLGNQNLDYNGTINLTEFNLGLLLGENKFFGKTSLELSLDGTAQTSDLLATAKAELSGKIASFDMMNYPLHLITVDGDFGKKIFQINLESKDPNIDFDFLGAIDLSNEKPVYKANMALKNFVPYVLAKNFSVVDTSKGFDKIIHYYQKHPSSNLSFSSLELNIHGNKLENLNGFVGFDGLSYSVDGKQLVGERLRLTMVNVEETIHKFILASSIVNATITTNYNLNVILDSLIGVAYHYVPNFLPERIITENSPQDTLDNDKEFYFRMHAETFNTRNFLDFFVPKLRIASGTTVSLFVNSLHKDSIEFSSNRIRYGEKMSVNNLSLKGNIAETEELLIKMNCDSLVFAQKKNNFVFSGIRWTSLLDDNKLTYQLNWFNPQMLFNKSASVLAGTVDGSSKEDIVFKITEALLDFQGNQWTFNKEHYIHLLPEALTFDNVVLQTKNSSLSANGIFSFKQKDNLNLDLVNFNLEQINFLLASRNISFGGNLSAQIKLDTWHLERIITGKVLVDDFKFNETDFGHLFLAGAAPGVQKVNFGGGLFQRDETFTSSSINHYSYSDYQKENHKLAKLTGTYSLAQKNLEVKADVDTLDIGFLSPFLASFSDVVKGKANGEISFIANTDSLYFKGIVNVIDGELGIAPLNTIYKLKNQEIGFDQQGLHFDNIQLTDIFGNKASMRGEVLHNKFKDFNVNLFIETNKIMALNIPKKSDIPFYGIGFVSGNVAITGNSEKILFTGRNLKTLSGSKLYLPLTFAESVSATEGVVFKVDESVTVNKTSEESHATMEFDFIFDITHDAEVQIDLDPAIGGTLKAKAEGPLKLAYKSDGDLNLNGILNIVSGKFSLAFVDVLFVANLDLVPKGTIMFNGSIYNSTLDLQAVHKTNASLQDIIPGYSTRRVPVNSYVNLKNNLMNPDINFTFELTEGTTEDNNILYNVLGLDDKGKSQLQFAYLLISSSFLSPNGGGQNGVNLDQNVAMEAGMDMLSKTLNTLLFNKIKYANLGINLKPKSEYSEAEYSVGAQIPLWNDRVIIQTSLGYVDSKDAERTSNVLGDFSIELKLTESGNWRLKAFYTSDPNYNHNVLDITQQNGWGAAGGAIVYRISFNDLKDFKRKEK